MRECSCCKKWVDLMKLNCSLLRNRFLWPPPILSKRSVSVSVSVYVSVSVSVSGWVSVWVSLSVSVSVTLLYMYLCRPCFVYTQKSNRHRY